MINSYDIVRHDIMEPDLIEVRGSFCIQDLYLLVGRQQFVCNFVFAEGSDAHLKFGRSVTGTVVYAPRQQWALKNGKEPIEDASILRIRALYPDLIQSLIDELRYGGVVIADVEEISFIPFVAQMDTHEDGTKRVPGVLYVELDDTSSVDVDILFQNLVVLKNNDGVELTPYERDRFIGTVLGIRGGIIDSRILNHFGYNPETASSSDDIAYYTLVTRQRRNTLSNEEAERLQQLEALRRLKRVGLLVEEIKRSGIALSQLAENQPQLAVIQQSVNSFEPHVLLNGKKQIYWDLPGYLHIALRHLTEMQIGSFKGKTPFPYKADELETLVERVLAQVEDEVRSHYAGADAKTPFARHGKMAIYFNGDHYHVKIDENGRLIAFHIVEPRDSEANLANS